jgi:phage-related protein
LEKSPFSPKFYQNDNRSPVTEFIDSLAKNEQATVQRKIQLHAMMGTALTYPHTRHIESKLWELRVNANGRFIRLFYFMRGNEIIYLHGVTKSRDKHLNSDIEIAKGRVNDLLNIK